MQTNTRNQPEKTERDYCGPVSVAQCKKLVEADCWLLDMRSAAVFAEGFIPGSIFIGSGAQFSGPVSGLLSRNLPVLLITEPGAETTAVSRMQQAGFTSVAGYLEGGYEAWHSAGEATDMLISVEADELAMDLPFDASLVTVDVRNVHEFAAGHIRGALNIPLSDFPDPAMIAGLEEERNLYLYSGNGYRSLVACSWLKKQGIHHLRNVTGGWEHIRAESRIPVEKDNTSLN